MWLKIFVFNQMFPVALVLFIIHGLFKYLSLPTPHAPDFSTLERRENYCVFSDLIPRTEDFPEDALTFITQGSTDHLPDLRLLAARWEGPISAAIFLSQSQFTVEAVSLLLLLRSCDRQLRRKASIHLITSAPANRTCSTVAHSNTSLKCKQCDCLDREMKRGIFTKRIPDYPVNVARNVARRGSRTKLELVADIQLVPSLGLASKFRRFFFQEKETGNENKAVYVIPVFEVKQSQMLPSNKKELLSLIKKGAAVSFHRFRAYECHRIPNLMDWWESGSATPDQLQLFHSGPWLRPCWEPVFIAAGPTPEYSEKFVGYGRNKIQQVYEMCRAGFEFRILDNAFFVHRGISYMTPVLWKRIGPTINRNNALFEAFKRELDAKYPDRQTAQYCDTKAMDIDGQTLYLH